MDPKFIEKAKVELREDEFRKTQALAQMRDWISKHPFLKGIRQDDVYLLQFLRVRKYNIDEAFKTLENTYLARKRYPNFLAVNEDNANKMIELFKTGYCFPLIGRDSEGRKIILVQTARLDTSVYSSYDASRLLCFITTVLMEEEETQIAGIIFVFDHANISIKHIVSPVEIRDFMDFVRTCASCRQKKTFAMNLPAFAHISVELALVALGEKLRKRFTLLKSSDELRKYIDISMLPVQYGGTTTEAEIMENYSKFRETKRQLIDQIIHFDIDWGKVPCVKIFLKDGDTGLSRDPEAVSQATAILLELFSRSALSTRCTLKMINQMSHVCVESAMEISIHLFG